MHSTMVDELRVDAKASSANVKEPNDRTKYGKDGALCCVGTDDDTPAGKWINLHSDEFNGATKYSVTS